MAKIYRGNCHCQAVCYEVTLEEDLAPEGPGQINRCNCSICTKNGYLLVYPKREDVKFLDNSISSLSDYTFGNKDKPHRFCKTCGSSVLIDFANSPHEQERPFLALNARLFEDFDLEKAAYRSFDGRNKLKPAYKQRSAEQKS